MANFGARLAYPVPDRIVARRRHEEEIASRRAFDRSSPFQRAIVRVVLTLLGMSPGPLLRDEGTTIVRPGMHDRTRRVA